MSIFALLSPNPEPRCCDFVYVRCSSFVPYALPSLASLLAMYSAFA